MGYEIIYMDLSFVLTSVIFAMCFLVNSGFGYYVCLKPASPYGGGNFIPLKDGYYVKDSVLYGCPTTKYLFGDKNRICLPNGTWSGSLPYCVGKRKVTNDVFKELFDDENGTCLRGSYHSATWTGLHVIGKCRRIIIEIVTKEPSPEIRVFYRNRNKVDQRFTLEGTQNENGNEFKSLRFSYSSSEALTDPHVVIEIYPCRSGYLCQICELIAFADVVASCERLIPENSATYISFDKAPPYPTNTFEYGSAAFFFCKQGFRLQGFNERRCSSKNRWTGKNSFCKEVVCSEKPPTILNGFWIGWRVTGTYHFKNSFKGGCEDGYRFYNETPIATCNFDGAWSVHPSDILCQKIECHERPPERENANWSSWEHGKIYPVNTTLEAICKYGYINYGQPIIATCNTDGNWSPEFLEDLCKDKSIFSSRRTSVIVGAVIGLILIMLSLGFCIFWRRRRIIERSKKKTQQAKDLLDNPIYNSSSLSLQGEECITPVCLQQEINSNVPYKLYSCVSNEELTTGMVTNEIYLTECPIAKAIHSYNPSIYANVQKEEQFKPTPTTHPKDEREMQEIVVDNEIYGTE